MAEKWQYYERAMKKRGLEPNVSGLRLSGLVGEGTGYRGLVRFRWNMAVAQPERRRRRRGGCGIFTNAVMRPDNLRRRHCSMISGGVD